MRTHQYGYQPQTGLFSRFRPECSHSVGYVTDKIDPTAVDFNDRVNPPLVKSRKYSRLYQFVAIDQFWMVFHHPVVHLFGQSDCAF